VETGPVTGTIFVGPAMELVSSVLFMLVIQAASPSAALEFGVGAPSGVTH
jgi:hypothetical protein